MSRTYRDRGRVNPRHANAIPYVRAKQHWDIEEENFNTGYTQKY